MYRRALLRGLASAGGLAGVSVASGHPGDRGRSGTETGPSGSGPGPHATLTMEAAREAVVGPDGTTTYVATMEGFTAIDVSDPHDPTILHEVTDVLPDHEDGPLEGIQDLKIDGTELLVVGPAHPSSGLKAAVRFDVVDPGDPRMIGSHVTEYPLHNAFLQDGIAYLCGNGEPGNPLVTVEIGAESTELGRWSLFDRNDAWRDVPRQLRTLHDVWVQDDLAYLAYWDAGTYVVDVSDPASPSFVSRVRGPDPASLPIEPAYAIIRESVVPPGNDHYVTTNEDGTLLGVGSETWAFQGSGGPSGITFYDVSDPTSPVERGRIEPPPSDDPSQSGVWTTAHNFELVGEYCYSAWYQGGVRIHDVSDPTAPVEAYRWRESDAARFWTAQLAVEGESFVAPTMGVPGDEDDGAEKGDGEDETESGLYVFPDVVHQRPTTATSTEDPGSSGAVGPGFGIGAALASALGLGAWLSRSGSGEDSPERPDG